MKILKRSKESMRKKHEWNKLKNSKRIEAKDKEIEKLKDQFSSKEKECKLFELKLKELHQVHKPLLTEEQNNEVMYLMQ